MKLTENINAPKTNVILPCDVINSPFVGGALLFKEIKMIEDLGVLYATPDSKRRRHYVIYECPFCGKHFKTRVRPVGQDPIKSCGCMNRVFSTNANTTHGLTKTDLHKIWSGMRSRCYNPNASNFKRYGGRGITICEEWYKDFKVFYDWSLNNGYLPGLIIDRKENDGNYCPENCRWATCSESIQNTRKQSNNTSGYKGVYKVPYDKWAVSIFAEGKKYFLGSFFNIIDAARAYDEAAKKYHGEFACLNFPENK
jgi:hypothetical protein